MKRLLLLLLLPLTAALVLGTAAPASADIDDFEFASFDASYTLDTDAEGRSVLTVVETLVAVFPEQQNRGIRRELVDQYDGHPTDLEVISVEDENGDARPYEAEGEDNAVVLTIAEDDYVQGEQTYVLTYTQHNVTRHFADTGADEFYWDTNGTDWEQPFGRVTATVTVAPDLVPRLTGEADAALGTEGETNPAEVTPTDDGYTFTATDLAPRENLSFAIGFEPDTFVPRDGSFDAAPWPLLSLLATIAALATTAGAVVLRRTRLRDAPGRGIVVPEYTPPKGVSVLLSAVILGRAASSNTAQILALAVAGNLRILEVTESKKPSYRLEYITDDGADVHVVEFLHALFGEELTAGESRSLKKADHKAAKRLAALQSRVTKAATTEGYRRALPAGPIAIVVTLAILSTAASFVFAVISLTEAYGGALPGIFLAVGVLALVATGVLLARVPLDRKGSELREYLQGLRMYITLAEADRLRYLQSPQGAERRPVAASVSMPVAVPVATDDRAEVVRLNERLLPYAVLFGLEKKWAEELGRYYEDVGTQPSWYAGHGAFNAALFASSIGSVSTSVSSYSSAGGGSTGGAASGGGGGGGGGGGV